MFYRGRLGRNQVKVLIVGQEGAQDESLSHRSFTGSTGTRMQFFLNYLGINQSYLFLNTFVYPIFNQYTGSKLKWLAQHPDSPIAKHRYELFDYVLARNDIQLVVAVGQAAKESIHDWVISRGGSCPDGTSDLSTATGNFLDTNTRIVGLRHPGGLAHPGNKVLIKDSFDTAIDQIGQWTSLNSNWLPVDPGASRDFSAPFEFLKTPIPFKDLPLGTNWRLGFGSTSSNRKDSQRSIQLYAKTGNRSARGIQYIGPANGSAEGYEQNSRNLPYEPPKEEYLAYDKGPSTGFTRLVMGGKPGYNWPDFSQLGVTAHPSLGYGCPYRGRPGKSTILVLADQHSHDDLFTCRALTGNAGQHFQGFLEAAGITSDYLILRSLPVDTLDLSMMERIQVANDPQVVKVYRKIFKAALRYQEAAVIILLGRVSQSLWDQIGVNHPTLPIIRLDNWSDGNEAVNWQAGLNTLRDLTYPKNTPATFQIPSERSAIPRQDLPFGTLCWQGTSGDRGLRGHDGNNVPDGRYYKYFQPRWVFNLDPTPLSPLEQAALSSMP